MKKFAILTIAGVLAIGGTFTSINAAAPAAKPVASSQPVAALKTATAFSAITFEDGEAVNWQVTGPNATKEVVTQNGSKALKVNMTARATEAANITRLVATPPAGTVWNIGSGSSLSATVTNPGSELIQVRVTVKDDKKNSRMAYFSIAAGATMDLLLTPEKLGSATPGVVGNSWVGNGYSGKGIDPSCITSMEFYFSETEAVVMKGMTSASYIVDNIKVVQPPAILTFPTTSFEPNETNWSVTGAAPITERVASGVVDGATALKVTIPERQTDWSKVTRLKIIPEGQTWDMGTANAITANITNENDYFIQLRVNVIDANKNSRMAYFTIPAKTSKEIIIDSVKLGTANIGVVENVWKGDGYSGKGVDKTKITGLEFYISEPEVAVMKDITTNISYIIDNVRAK
ncbi:MAG: hypothetical protein ATN31_00625 [Candidatus Epulonipiscioides saccharophilum]|nr:MAG: hypothetical protein ATN31_00625 [Epulopiscium sp. AS2M-Bin001]